ncbi:MAG TPA: hypothetical protein VKM56_02715, partial [Verrucomicrobiae bacterium]|nr:hypothetical protein [Verrucomicrobiae bacterium]
LPNWLPKTAGNASVLLLATRGTGRLLLQDPAPYYIHRALPLLGRTLDTGRLADILGTAKRWLDSEAGKKNRWKIIGRGEVGVIGAYAAVLDPRIAEVILVDPPASHRDGPIFLNVLRVLDIPEALGLLAPRPLTIYTTRASAFERTVSIYAAAGGPLKLQALP